MPSDNTQEPAFHYIDFNHLYNDLIVDNDWNTLSTILNDKKLTVRDGDVTYRLINHWMSAGLLDDDRDEPSKGWRKLSYKDVVWLRIIRDLRNFGLSLDKIRVTYHNLFRKSQTYSSRDFELAIMMCSANPPMNFFIIVFDDGSAKVATLQSLWYNEATNGYATPYLRISLNALVCETLGSDRFTPEKVHPIVLNGEELDVIGNLREGGFDDMHVRVKNGEVHQIDKSRSIRDAERISDLLDQTRFGEITIKIENSKVVHTQHLKKERL